MQTLQISWETLYYAYKSKQKQNKQKKIKVTKVLAIFRTVTVLRSVYLQIYSLLIQITGNWILSPSIF